MRQENSFCPTNKVPIRSLVSIPKDHFTAHFYRNIRSFDFYADEFNIIYH
jgi:hypothetical protein